MAAECASVVEALSAVMDDVRSVRKGDRNTQHGYVFRGVDAVVNAVGPALRAHKVIVVPDVRSVEYATVEVGQKRTLMGHVRVVVAYTFHGPGGDVVTCSAAGEAMDSGDKATPKAMSVAFRTALLQALCLPTDEADPDSASYDRSDVEDTPPKPTIPSVDKAISRLAELDTAEALDGAQAWAADLYERQMWGDEQIDGFNRAMSLARTRIDHSATAVTGEVTDGSET